MKCQKNRACVKQPPNAPPDTRKRCSGCDKPGKDKTTDKNRRDAILRRDKARKNAILAQAYTSTGWTNGHPASAYARDPHAVKIAKSHDITISGDRYLSLWVNLGDGYQHLCVRLRGKKHALYWNGREFVPSKKRAK